MDRYHDEFSVPGMYGVRPENDRNLVETFNATRRVCPQPAVVHELFEQQVRKTPAAVAVEHEHESLSYDELNERANRLAWYLAGQGVGPDKRVGICLERSLDLVVALLAILKAGAAYVPLDPEYPPERLTHMLKDAVPNVLLTQRKLAYRFPEIGVAKMVAIDDEWRRIASHPSVDREAVSIGLCSDHLVYVIYTSGSTGRPKGTAMAHHSMINLIEWHRSVFGSGEGKRVLQFAALSFDVAFQEVFSTLCTGGTLVLLHEWIRRDPEALWNFLHNRRIQRLFIPPVMLQSLTDCANGTGPAAGALEDVITAGEQLRVSPELAQLFLRQFPCRLHNHYGPTETHVVTALTLAGNPCQWPAVPSIGRPIANTQLFILDEMSKPVSVGEVGEIYIRGAGVARGYLERPELTAVRFVADPFDGSHGARMYRTGDLARWQADGTIEFLGRNDHQVKLRGFRVELGEIESALIRHELVKDAIVVVRDYSAGEKRLVAYIILRSGAVGESSGELDVASDARDAASSPNDHVPAERKCIAMVRTRLEAVLPPHMVPSAIVALKEFPLTPIGKVDRAALPPPAPDAYAVEEHEAPLGDIELTIASIWQEVLQLERVGRWDHFFKLGGHSLLVAKMLRRAQQCGLFAEPQVIYSNPTLASFAGALKLHGAYSVEIPNGIPNGCAFITSEMLTLTKLDASQINSIAATIPGGMGNIQDIYPLTPMQQGILFHDQLSVQGGSDTYVIKVLLETTSRKDLDDFLAVLQALINRHDALRTAVIWEGLPHAVQVVCRRAVLSVHEFELASDPDPTEQMTSVADNPQLDIRLAPLMQVGVAADSQGVRWYVVLRVHHIVLDQASLDSLLREAATCIAGDSHMLPTPLSYRNHVARVLRLANHRDANAFFRAKLAGVTEPTAPFGLINVHADSSTIRQATEQLEVELIGKLRFHARQLGVTVAALFHVGWALVLSHTCGRDDPVFGTVLFGRMNGSTADELSTLGLFINTLPLRIHLENFSIRELIHQTQSEMVELLEHEQASLTEAQRSSGMTAGVPLFSSLLNYVRDFSEGKSTFPSGKVRHLATSVATNYPIVMSVEDRFDGIVLKTQSDRRIEPNRVLGYFTTALRSMVNALESSNQIPALAVSVLPERERTTIVETFNSSEGWYPRATLAHSLFEEKVLQNPDAVAVVCEDRAVTYDTLNRKANELAHALLGRGVRPDDRVGLYVDRGVEMIVGILAIAKAGGAYVPLDVNYPAERVAYMIRDSAPVLILTLERVGDSLPDSEVPILAIDGDENDVNIQADTNPDPERLALSSHHLVYVIYTSGSTGAPKGVMVTHRNLVNLVDWTGRAFALSPRDRSSCLAAIGFDAAAWEIWPTLSVGGTLLLASPRLTRDPEALLAWWAVESMDVSFLPTPIAELAFSRRIHNRGLRVLSVGGDRLRTACPPNILLVNNYGPTECTVVATSGPLAVEETVLHIGRPIRNTRIYILDRHGEVVPIGVTGEIFVGGAGVARGYLNRPDLTAERFISDPLGGSLDARMYRTGDLGRWREDGTIEFLGRNDDQVKIRGNRIELGEIEAQLAAHEDVCDVVVVAREVVPGEPRLVAYVTQADGRDADPDALRTHLESTLPGYMIPSAFIVLEALPLTVHGKLDRRALPLPDPGAFASSLYEPPKGQIEESLAVIWREVLRIERIGRYDDFFKLGGHSLLAMQVTARIRSLFTLDFSMSTLLECPTIEQVSERIDALREEQILKRLAEGGDDIEDLIERVRAMPDDQVRALRGVQDQRRG